MGLIQVSAAGSPLPDAMVAALVRAEVEQELNMPAMCRLEMGSVDSDDGDWQGVDLTTLRIGDPMVVAFGEPTPTVLFEGEIGAIEATFARESTVEIRGYDALYKLQFGTAQRIFEGVTVEQMATAIAEQHGLTIDPGEGGSQVTYPYVIQPDQSDYVFLSARAARISYEMQATGRQLYFGPTRAGQGAKMTLNFNEGVPRVTVRLKAVKQGSSVQRVGWDPVNKRPIVADVSSGSSSLRMGGTETGYEISAAIAPSAVAAMDPEITDAASARELAEAAYEADLDEFIEASVLMLGDPAARPGINVVLQGIGPRFSGLYYVTAAKHVYTMQDSYTTELTLRRTGV
jgi:phage protein D